MHTHIIFLWIQSGINQSGTVEIRKRLKESVNRSPAGVKEAAPSGRGSSSFREKNSVTSTRSTGRSIYDNGSCRSRSRSTSSERRTSGTPTKNRVYRREGSPQPAATAAAAAAKTALSICSQRNLGEIVFNLIPPTWRLHDFW